ncbi:MULTISPECIES: cupin domain-containing protein [Nostocales]|uniref:Cupin 2 conserved barrel domain protein n=2 Tax=Nostocales TaxID=1161 RepID=A0A0C1R4N1_9CYAN|nr:cupin 2 conserved barrel domain protein [Tolypothrix bouteillei]KAF3886757.1 cupin domain-containing protein [Tolypothrix bouteillei VB521301]
MFIVNTDTVVKVDPNNPPNYHQGNPLQKLLNLMEQAQLAVEREFYLMEHAQYLFPFEWLSIYGPSGNQADIVEPTQQDNKEDFQKQNIRDFRSTDTFLVRGLVRVGDSVVPFLRVSYRGGPDSKLSVASERKLGEKIKLWIKVGDVITPSLIGVPYNPASDRYEVELWGYPGSDLFERLDTKGRKAIERLELQVRTDLVHGDMSAFVRRSELNGRHVEDIDPKNTMHPILPLHVELAWTDFDERAWDAQNGANYHYEFNMILRGWDNYLETGISSSPHSGPGFLEYRNLLSNYGRKSQKLGDIDRNGNRINELGRLLNPWSFNAFDSKNHGSDSEPFFAVNYVDLNILKSGCGIGLHRHRDNQEIFFLVSGQGFMVMGDWCKMPQRERCFEIRTFRPGYLTMLKPGNLHGLMNSTDRDMTLFSFGGYD